MYEIVDKLEGIMLILVITSFCCLIGQEIEKFRPDNWGITALFFLFAFVGGLCCAYTTIYEKGRFSILKEQEDLKDHSGD